MTIRTARINDPVIDTDGNRGTISELPGYGFVPDDSVGVTFTTGFFIVEKRHLSRG